jgi:hypothetical protein
VYSVVLVVSDRAMSDFENANTIQSIQKASEQPLSIVFIGGLSAIVEEQQQQQQPLPTLPTLPPPPRSVPSTRSIRSYSTQSSSSVASLSSSTSTASAADNRGKPPLSEQSCTALNAHCSRQIFSFVR